MQRVRECRAVRPLVPTSIKAIVNRRTCVTCCCEQVLTCSVPNPHPRHMHSPTLWVTFGFLPVHKDLHLQLPSHLRLGHSADSLTCKGDSKCYVLLRPLSSWPTTRLGSTGKYLSHPQECLQDQGLCANWFSFVQRKLDGKDFQEKVSVKYLKEEKRSEIRPLVLKSISK